MDGHDRFRLLLPAAVESTVAKTVSLGVKLGALVFIVFLPTQYAIDLQLLGGVWILQIFPAVVFGVWRTSLRSRGLLAGWLTGMIVGTWMAEAMQLKPVFPFVLGGQTCGRTVPACSASGEVRRDALLTWEGKAGRLTYLGR